MVYSLGFSIKLYVHGGLLDDQVFMEQQSMCTYSKLFSALQVGIVSSIVIGRQGAAHI